MQIRRQLSNYRVTFSPGCGRIGYPGNSVCPSGDLARTISRTYFPVAHDVIGLSFAIVLNHKEIKLANAVGNE